MPAVKDDFVRILREELTLGINFVGCVMPGGQLTEILQGIESCKVQAAEVLVVCWTVNDCLSKGRTKHYKFKPTDALARPYLQLITVMSRLPKSVLVLAGNSSTWTMSVGANERTAFQNSCRAVALHHGVACIDGTTWHAYGQPYRTSNGSHTRSTFASRQMWRWLLLATATYAAEQPRIRSFPTTYPIEPYPQATLRLPAQVEPAAAAAAAVQEMAPRPLVPPVHPD